jgi:hypothetical protein
MSYDEMGKGVKSDGSTELKSTTMGENVLITWWFADFLESMLGIKGNGKSER